MLEQNELLSGRKEWCRTPFALKVLKKTGGVCERLPLSGG